MGRKEKAKAARKAGHPYSDTRQDILNQQQSNQETQPGSSGERQLHASLGTYSYPFCQAIVEPKRTTKCQASIHPGGTKWCSYHVQMRLDLHASFHDLLKEYRARAAVLPNMALVQETIDLDWLRGLAGPLRTRLEILGRCLLNRVCFMEWMHGEDLSFGTKNATKDLRDARTRLQGHLCTIEQRMLTLILCTHEDQTPVAGLSAQLLGRVDKANQRCIHHTEDPERDFSSGPIFPVARRYHQKVAAGGVVDAYLEAEHMRLRRWLLSKMGIQVIEPVDKGEGILLVTHWDSLVDHERAHIAAAYFRRIIFNEAHLFVPAHFHTITFKERTIDLPSIITRDGDDLDLTDEIDASMLCIITFILSANLGITHLELLRDYVIWPAHLEVRTAVQDVVFDIMAFQKANKTPSPPYWAHPIRRDLLEPKYDDPEGTFPLLCGTLYEAGYLHAIRDDTLEAKFWPHIASLIRCGKCLFATVHSADEWCDVVRTLSVHRVPLYARIFPQIIGSPVGDLWTSDRVFDEIRGQAGEKACHYEGQAPCRYRMDEVLEMAGVTMLGIIEGGPVDTRGVVDPNTERFMRKFMLLPQLWFFLPTYDPLANDFLYELLKRSYAADAAFTFTAVTEDESINDDMNNAPPLTNALRLSLNAQWQPAELSLDDLRLLTRMRYDPLPRRIQDDNTFVHIATKHLPPNASVQTILNLILDICMLVNRVCSRPALEHELEHTLERKFGMAHRDHEEKISYRFCPTQVNPPSVGSDNAMDMDENEAQSQGSELAPFETKSDHPPDSPTHERSASPSPSTATSTFPPPMGISETGIDKGKTSSSILACETKAHVPSVAHTRWFDLMMTAEASDLPDLSDWGAALL